MNDGFALIIGGGTLNPSLLFFALSGYGDIKTLGARTNEPPSETLIT